MTFFSTSIAIFSWKRKFSFNGSYWLKVDVNIIWLISQKLLEDMLQRARPKLGLESRGLLRHFTGHRAQRVWGTSDTGSCQHDQPKRPEKNEKLGKKRMHFVHIFLFYIFLSIQAIVMVKSSLFGIPCSYFGV
jgi:hypothetical protein